MAAIVTALAVAAMYYGDTVVAVDRAVVTIITADNALGINSTAAG